jgi:hypothetical protein
VSGVSAENMDIDPSYQQIPYADEFATYYVKIYSIQEAGIEHTIEVNMRVWGSGRKDDLEFQFTNSAGVSSAWLESGGKWNWGVPTGNEETIKMRVRAKLGAPENNNYRFFVRDLSGAGESAGATVIGNSIPEFTTVAVPVGIALLFAMLYFRKGGGDRK